jgi:hypothetical protein
MKSPKLTKSQIAQVLGDEAGLRTKDLGLSKSEIRNPKSEIQTDAFLQLIPRYECPQCESFIPQSAVFGKPITVTGLEVAVQKKVEVYCQHCDAAFTAILQLQSGQWAIVDGPTRLNKRQSAALRHRVEENQGVIHMEKLNRSAA